MIHPTTSGSWAMIHRIIRGEAVDFWVGVVDFWVGVVDFWVGLVDFVDF